MCGLTRARRCRKLIVPKKVTADAPAPSRPHVCRLTGPSPLYADGGLAQLYDSANTTRADLAMCRSLAESAGSVLDLGCGTGTLALALAPGRRETGVEPAAGMLEQARRKDDAGRINWVQGDARTLRLDQTFDLVLLTGHTFQVFLTPEDRLACLRSIAAHLSDTGRFVFDSRNPDFPEPKERTKTQTLRRFHDPDLGEVQMWNVSRYDAAARILTYSNHFRIVATGEVRGGEDRIAYPPQPELAALLTEAGLRAHRWMGDWEGAPFHAASREIIPVGGLARP